MTKFLFALALVYLAAVTLEVNVSAFDTPLEYMRQTVATLFAYFQSGMTTHDNYASRTAATAWVSERV